MGPLHPDEIEGVLHRSHLGRLACISRGRPYIVPISFAYAGGDVYGHTLPGRKLAAMRIEPHVCFEVDVYEDAATVLSVVADGVFEELIGTAERRAALGMLAGHGPSALPATDEPPGVVFRLRLTEKSGRVVRREP